MITYFGSWERRSGMEVYMISSKCDCKDIIHRLEFMFSPLELEVANIDVFAIARARMDLKYERIHRVVIPLR